MGYSPSGVDRPAALLPLLAGRPFFFGAKGQDLRDLQDLRDWGMITEAAQVELDRVYDRAWYETLGTLTAIGQILEEDFPKPGDGERRPTRGDLDMVRALNWRLSALVEGYERGQGERKPAWRVLGWFVLNLRYITAQRRGELGELGRVRSGRVGQSQQFTAVGCQPDGADAAVGGTYHRV